MALISNVVVSNTGDTFGTWVERTNDVIERLNSLGLTANTLSVNAVTTNTVHANTLNVARESLLTGNVTLTGNTVVSGNGTSMTLVGPFESQNTVNLTGNVTISAPILTVDSGVAATVNGTVHQVGRLTVDGDVDSNGTIGVLSNTTFTGANTNFSGPSSLFEANAVFSSRVVIKGPVVSDNHPNVPVQSNVVFSGANTDVQSHFLVSGNAVFSGSNVHVTSLTTENKSLSGAFDELNENILAFSIALG